MTTTYELQNCTDFMDIFLTVKNYGADIKAATKKVWSARKYRKPEDTRFAIENYRDDWNLIDQLLKLDEA